MLIKVFDHVGKYAIAIEDGRTIRDIALQHIDEEPIILDFSNVAIVATPFLNASIGELTKDRDDVDKRVSIQNAEEYVSHHLSRVISNSWRYFHDENYRIAVDDTIGRFIEDEWGGEEYEDEDYDY